MLLQCTTGQITHICKAHGKTIYTWLLIARHNRYIIAKEHPVIRTSFNLAVKNTMEKNAAGTYTHTHTHALQKMFSILTVIDRQSIFHGTNNTGMWFIAHRFTWEALLHYNLGQVAHTVGSLSPSRIVWYWPTGRWCAAVWKVNTGMADRVRFKVPPNTL